MGQRELKKRGRPLKTSRTLIQEAAFELFQQQGYESTTVEQIAKTAGYSRATFFNYFTSKNQIFWLETDELIAQLEYELENVLVSVKEDKSKIENRLSEFAAKLSAEKIPWALANYQLINSEQELLSSGLSRINKLQQVIKNYLESVGQYQSGFDYKIKSFQITAAVLAAAQEWIASGVNRKPFNSYLNQALNLSF